MTKRMGGARRKTRSKLRKKARESGKLSVSKYFQVFNIGESVYLVANPTVQRGMFHPRFHGLQGKVVGKKGACYEVQIKDGGKTKVLISHPIHLKKC
ncbi:50S ribosomal protein L21e [Candidatus Woesearchaeota archaeon]|nr:50S ribosomal protein L21e [Candidatus Woesearchaeota archaeon]